MVLPATGKSQSNEQKKKAGWNDYVKEKREVAMYWHTKWKHEGSPVNSFTAVMRRKTRLQYHYAIKCIEKNKNIIKSNNMARKFIEKPNKAWKECSKLRGRKNKIPNIVDNITGEKNISELFGNQFNGLLNSVGSDVTKIENLKAVLNDSLENSNSEYSIQNNELIDSLKSLATGKSDGYLGIYSDHLIHGTEMLCSFLTDLFNSMLNHGFTPSKMNVGTIIPLIKDKSKGMSDSSNFRGICLQSALCKLLDKVILKKEEEKLRTSNLQFGFKSCISSHMAVSVVQETVDYYTNQGNTVYGLALDASKAFDRVEFYKLFQCLITRDVNLIVVRFLLNMYLSQNIRVRFNQTHSELFQVSNGVKQGGVLSPILFSIYIDILIESLQTSGYGCRVGDVYVGCVAYADDILILTASLFSLNKMIKICENYAVDYHVKFNGNKSKLIISQKNGAFHNPIQICKFRESRNCEQY